MASTGETPASSAPPEAHQLLARGAHRARLWKAHVSYPIPCGPATLLSLSGWRGRDPSTTQQACPVQPRRVIAAVVEQAAWTALSEALTHTLSPRRVLAEQRRQYRQHAPASDAARREALGAHSGPRSGDHVLRGSICLERGTGPGLTWRMRGSPPSWTPPSGSSVGSPRHPMRRRFMRCGGRSGIWATGWPVLSRRIVARYSMRSERSWLAMAG